MFCFYRRISFHLLTPNIAITSKFGFFKLSFGLKVFHFNLCLHEIFFAGIVQCYRKSTTTGYLQNNCNNQEWLWQRLCDPWHLKALLCFSVQNTLFTSLLKSLNWFGSCKALLIIFERNATLSNVIKAGSITVIMTQVKLWKK